MKKNLILPVITACVISLCCIGLAQKNKHDHSYDATQNNSSANSVSSLPAGTSAPDTKNDAPEEPDTAEETYETVPFRQTKRISVSAFKNIFPASKKYKDIADMWAYFGNTLIYTTDRMPASNGNIDAADTTFYLYDVHTKESQKLITLKNLRYSSGDSIIKNDNLYLHAALDGGNGTEENYLYQISLSGGKAKIFPFPNANVPLVHLGWSDSLCFLKRNEAANGDMTYRILRMDKNFKKATTLDEAFSQRGTGNCLVDITDSEGKLYSYESSSGKPRCINEYLGDNEKNTYELQMDSFLEMPEEYQEEEGEVDYFLKFIKKKNYIAMETGYGRVCLLRFQGKKLVPVAAPEACSSYEEGSRIVPCQSERYIAMKAFDTDSLYIYDIEKEGFYCYDFTFKNKEEDAYYPTISSMYIGEDGSLLIKIAYEDFSGAWKYIPAFLEK